MEIPEFVTKKLEEISNRTGMEIRQVQQEYEEFFNSDFVKEDPSFTNDEDRHQYAKGVFWTRYILRKPTKPFNLIPIGVDSIRKSKRSGELNTSLFAIDSKGKLRRISFKGDICKVVKNIAFFNLYKGVMLGEFKDSNDLLADDRADFSTPVKIDMSPTQILENLPVEVTTIIDVKNHLSRKGSDGFVAKDDWKCIRGLVQRWNRSQEDSEGEWGIYSIADETVDPEKMEPEVTPTGEILPPGFTLWTSPTLMNYGRDSECWFYGTVQKDDKGKVTMNCFCILPIHVRYEG